MDQDNSKPVLQLTDKELQICTDLLYTASTAAEKYAYSAVLSTHIDEKQVRYLKSILDLFCLAAAGNPEAIQHIAGIEEKAVLNAFSDLKTNSQCNLDDVFHLHKRFKGFLKELKQPHIPPQILYIADCHFYHNRICFEMDHRGFSGYEEMNEHMIVQWNKKVRPKDEVYILGDFCITKGIAAEKILERLNGKLHLIIGNHDKYLEDKSFDRTWFRSIEHYEEIHDNGRTVILSHYPIFCYNGQYRRDQAGNPLFYMLYGHVHNTHDENLVNQFIMETRQTKVMSKHSTEPEPIQCNMINCFCMFSNYQPMTLDEWIVIDRERRKKQAIKCAN